MIAYMDTSTVLEPLNVNSRAEVLKAIADPTRIDILDMLSPEVRCNCQFQEQLNLAPSLLSYHLGVLRESGLIVGTKRGRWVDYELAADAGRLIEAALPQGLR
jgi:ArsR family transcriptional regulator